METVFNYIVYQTVNTINGKIYIGVHKTNTLKFDGYLGQDIYVNQPSSLNGLKTHFSRAVKKYGFKAFKRTTIKTFQTLEDALDLERWIVDEEFIKRPDTYNMILGGKSGTLPTNATKTYMYDLEGNFVQEFESRSAAARFVYGNSKAVGTITTAIKTGSICAEKYQFSATKVDCMVNYVNYKGTIWEEHVEKYKTGIRKRNDALIPRKIAQYDLEGNLIKVWPTLTACKAAGFTNVQRIVQGQGHTCKGYTFKYYED